jgi:hypothetical protein
LFPKPGAPLPNEEDFANDDILCFCFCECIYKKEKKTSLRRKERVAAGFQVQINVEETRYFFTENHSFFEVVNFIFMSWEVLTPIVIVINFEVNVRRGIIEFSWFSEPSI